MRTRRHLLFTFSLALAIAAPALTALNWSAPGDWPASANAAVSVAITLEELTTSSTHIVVATAGDKRSVWEDLPGGRRIVTYTRFHVESSTGTSPGQDIEVRTLGGAVGNIGQLVNGDAKIGKGERALLFLLKTSSGALVVNGLAQGHFPIRADKDGNPKLFASPDAGSIVPRRGPTISVQERLLGLSPQAALALIESVQRAQKP